jgi:hypothetical protein
MTDPYVGQLTFFRVYSGVLNSGDTIYNPIKGRKERIGRILQMHANQREEIKEVRAGDIAAAVGLKEATTGETLCDPEQGDHSREDGVPRAGDSTLPSNRRPRPTRRRWASPLTAWRRRILLSACVPTKSPARPSSPAWANCTSRSSSIA